MVVERIPAAGAAVSEDQYRRLALGSPTAQWELIGGRLREKPPMSARHGDLMSQLGVSVQTQLDRREFRVRFGHARLRRSPTHYYVPDLAVIPTGLDPAAQGEPDALDAYAAPLPLVLEIWSPSTGDYDAVTKIPEYMERGDLEIWRLHPVERSLTSWVRQPDGSYVETRCARGVIQASALPGVLIDLDDLFAT